MNLRITSKILLIVTIVVVCNRLSLANDSVPPVNSTSVVNGKSQSTSKGIQENKKYNEQAVEYVKSANPSERVSIRKQNKPADIVVTNSATNNSTAEKNQIFGKDKSDIASEPAYRESDSSYNSNFRIYNARTHLKTDIDGDGYFSEFEITFDADTNYASAEVYAVFYISKHAEPWEVYYETDSFRIYGYRSDDAYSVTTILNFDYPTDEYNVLIDLYEVGQSQIVATLSPNEDPDLFALPLEDVADDADYSNGFDIHDIETELITDRDTDGFFSEFSMSIDIDTIYAQSLVYAEIYFINEFNQWELEFTSTDVAIFNNSSADSLDINFSWQSGYPTGHYDFKVVIFDAYSHQKLFETDNSYNGLSNIPLESRNTDSNLSSAVDPSVYSSSSYGTGGGSLGPWLILLFCAAMARLFRE